MVRLTQDEDGTIAFNGGLMTRDFQKAFGYIETRVQFSTQPGWWGPLEQVFYVDGQETLRLSYKDTPITPVPQKLFVGGVHRTPPKLKKDAEDDGKNPPFFG